MRIPPTLNALIDPRAARRAGRALHVVDAENLAAGPFELARCAHLGDAYLRAAPWRAGDLVVVGTDVMNVFTAAQQFPGAQLVAGRGPDGADRALLKAVDWDVLAARFDGLVIGSGDGAFALLARRARVLGFEVTVVARPGSLARALLRSADRVVWFDPTRPRDRQRAVRSARADDGGMSSRGAA